MKKTLKYLLTAVCGCALLASCMQKEMDVPATRHKDGPQPEGKVAVQFTVAMPHLEAQLTTKADTRAYDPAIQTMHVAVFGGSGYLKEYTEAELVSMAVTNYDGNAQDIYTYKVNLSLTTSSIKVHFIGNGPSELNFDYEAKVIPLLHKSLNDTYTDGYWQRKLVPNGIQALKYNGVSYTGVKDGQPITRSGATYMDDNGQMVEEGDYINLAGNKITNGSGYIVSPQTIADLSGIQLIRNFARITVKNVASNFVMKSYAIINQPNEGTLAPYENQWFDYLSYSDQNQDEGYDAYEELLKVYSGAEVINVSYDKTLPTEANFVTPGGSGGRVKAATTGTEDGKPYQMGAESFIYERKAPSGVDATPTVLIIYGTYTPDSGSPVDCYYKIDLMEQGKYLTIFRNFQYNITIKTILKAGKTTVKDAYEGAGSGDISSDTNASNLTDISDGTVRLYVLEMAPVIVGQQNDYEIQYKFVTNVQTGDASVNNRYGTETDPAITFTGGDGTGNVIASYSVDDNTGDASNGYYRTLHFTTKNPSASTQRETFRITAEYVDNGGTTHKLYRDINFTLLNVQQLQVQCIPDEVVAQEKQEMTVRVTIPTGLPQAMFPLQFAIEAQNKSIDPRYDVEQNLPVKHGQTYQYTTDGTTYTRTSGNAFYFIRELTYAEYTGYNKPGSTYPAGSEADGTMYFDSFFKTTKAQSASNVFVGCLRAVDTNGQEKGYDYFNPGMDDFTNYTLRHFTWETIPEWEAGTDQTVRFRVETGDKQDVYVSLSGLTAADFDSGLSGTETADVYKVPAGDIPPDGIVIIKVHVPDTKGYTAGIGLSAKHYEDESTSGTIGKWVYGEHTETTVVPVNFTTTPNTVGNNGTITVNNVTLTFGGTWARPSRADYIEVGGSGYQYRTGTMTVTAGNALTRLANFSITSVTFTYAEGYAEGNVTSTAGGTYQLTQNTGSWSGSGTSGIRFTMYPYEYNYYYTYYIANRVQAVGVTYSYTTTTTGNFFDTSKD